MSSTEGDLLREQVRHLTAGLEKIVALKDVKQVKDPLVQIAGCDPVDDEGWSTIHPRMKKGLEHASRMARETLDSMPK